jgi:hypothetical protein
VSESVPGKPLGNKHTVYWVILCVSIDNDWELVVVLISITTSREYQAKSTTETETAADLQ